MGRKWEPYEQDAVARLYAEGGVAAVQAEIPHRTSIEIRSWARGHGYTFQPRVMPVGSEAEIEALYLQGGYPAVREKFPGITDRAMYSWAHRKGLRPPKRARKPRARKPRPERAPPPIATALPFGERKTCVRLRKWRGPVSHERPPLVATIGRKVA